MVSMNALKTVFRKDEVLVLLGAGASVEAGIPHSAKMIDEIEKALGGEWENFRDLYNFVRSAIFFADGIQGTFGADVPYNIERLVVSLDELSRREEHPLYPFIGAWNPRLAQVAGSQFVHVSEFKIEILKRLRHQWIEINNYQSASYFRGLVDFQKELNFPLHVFTLNYDLCVEKAYQSVYNEFPERGFDRDRHWNPGLLDDSVPSDSKIFLYKLHGSIDWVRDSNRTLTFSDSTSKIGPSEGEMIFGTTYKLQSVDPFLFLVYQLRRRTLDARLLITIGYGFGDEHINGILGQALRNAKERKLVALTWFGDGLSDELISRQETRFKAVIAKRLGVPDMSEQLIVAAQTAKSFLSGKLTIGEMAQLFPPEETLFSVLPNEDERSEPSS